MYLWFSENILLIFACRLGGSRPYEFLEMNLCSVSAVAQQHYNSGVNNIHKDTCSGAQHNTLPHTQRAS